MKISHILSLAVAICVAPLVVADEFGPISEAQPARRCFKDADEDGICDKSQRAGGRCNKNCVDQDAYKAAHPEGEAEAPAQDKPESPSVSACSACPNAGNCASCPLKELAARFSQKAVA